MNNFSTCINIDTHVEKKVSVNYSNLFTGSRLKSVTNTSPLTSISGYTHISIVNGISFLVSYSAYSFDFMKGATSDVGFHLPP